MIYNQTLLAPPKEQFGVHEDAIEHVNEENVYTQLISHVKSFVPHAKYLNDEDTDEGAQYSDPFDDIQDESLLSRFHLPYVHEKLEAEENNLSNIQQLLSSLDEDQEEKDPLSNLRKTQFKGRFNIDSYILDCTSLEQIFMSLLHVSNISKNNIPL